VIEVLPAAVVSEIGNREEKVPRERDRERERETARERMRETGNRESIECQKKNKKKLCSSHSFVASNGSKNLEQYKRGYWSDYYDAIVARANNSQGKNSMPTATFANATVTKVKEEE
jgi:hypothetical protein